ncbi:MAG: cupin domain-containing protein [Actinomycetota bacterium]
MESKTFDKPDELKTPPKTKIAIVNIGASSVHRGTFEPGWKWSEDVKPTAGTDACEIHHLMCGISGRLKISMNDGTEMEMGPGDVVDIPPGHDAWVVGDEPFVVLDVAGVKIA